MTLHTDANMNTFAANMKALWKDWATKNPDQRRTAVDSAITAATNGLHTPTIQHAALGANTCGSFSWGAWKLKVNNAYTNNNALKYEDFLELCATIYHETRHSEQFFRVAQGLSAGVISFPDQSESSNINLKTKTDGPGSVADRVKMFQDHAKGEKVKATPKMIAKLLNIPETAATAASTNAQANFTTFTRTAVPAWFARKTIQLEVEEWMRECYKASLSELGNWAQTDRAPYKMYKDQPTERDAHGIEDGVVTKITTAIGVTEANGKGKVRTHAVFNNIP